MFYSKRITSDVDLTTEDVLHLKHFIDDSLNVSNISRNAAICMFARVHAQVAPETKQKKLAAWGCICLATQLFETDGEAYTIADTDLDSKQQWDMIRMTRAIMMALDFTFMADYKRLSRTHTINTTRREMPLPDHIFTHDKLGQGNYGRVFRSIMVTQNNVRWVAEKKSLFDPNTDYQHFIREVAALQILEGLPGIPQICRVEPGTIYMSMEQITLHRLSLDRTNMFSMQQVINWSQQLVHTLQHVHEKNVVHRDLSAANVMLNAAKDTVTIIDWGASAFEVGHGQDLHDLWPITTTIWYRPPEQFVQRSNFHPFAGDIWSAGCVLGQLILREPLFPISEREKITKKMIAEVVQKIKDVNYPEWFLDLIVQMLHANPLQRLTASQCVEILNLMNVV